MKQFYDADYIIRKMSEQRDNEIYNSPAERKLRELIKNATIACEQEKEKFRKQKEKLEARKREKKANKEEEQEREM